MNDIKVVKNLGPGTVSIVKIGHVPGKWGWENLSIPGNAEVDLSLKYSKVETSKCANLEVAVKMGLLKVVRTYSSRANVAKPASKSTKPAITAKVAPIKPAVPAKSPSAKASVVKSPPVPGQAPKK